jgi:hypothetical protein
MRYLKEQRKVRSRPGFGYDIRRGKFTPSAKEQAIIEQIRAWREGGLSYRDIETLPNTSGVPTKRGRQWAAMTVQKIVGRAEA